MSGEGQNSAVAGIRRRPQMYFGTATPDAACLVSLLVDDLFESGAADFRVTTDGDLTVVASAVDWMATAGRPVAGLFEGFVTVRRRGNPNAFRAEVLVAAACDAFATDGPVGRCVRGLEVTDLLARGAVAAPPGGRWLAFRMAAEKG